jgi:UDP-N-acetylenolpyruvoylglucosamine reductase
MHANVNVAEPGASAADVVALMAEVRAMVQSDAGVLLEPEVRLVGSFP